MVAGYVAPMRRKLFICLLVVGFLTVTHYLVLSRVKRLKLVPVESFRYSNNSWIRVPKSKLLIYSAFAEKSRNQTKVVCHVERAKIPKKLFCSCFRSKPLGGDLSETKRLLQKFIKASIYVLPEHHGYPYSACFVYCPCKSNFISLATNSAIRGLYKSNSNAIPIINVLPPRLPVRMEKKYNLSMCVKPIYGSINPALLWEFTQYYRMQGVEFFTFYVYNGTGTEPLLMKYAGRDNVEINEWKLPLTSRVQVHTVGIIGAINDCLLRRRRDSKYVIQGAVVITAQPHSHSPQQLISTNSSSLTTPAGRITTSNKYPISTSLPITTPPRCSCETPSSGANGPETPIYKTNISLPTPKNSTFSTKSTTRHTSTRPASDRNSSSARISSKSSATILSGRTRQKTPIQSPQIPTTCCCTIIARLSAGHIARNNGRIEQLIRPDRNLAVDWCVSCLRKTFSDCVRNRDALLGLRRKLYSLKHSFMYFNSWQQTFR